MRRARQRPSQQRNDRRQRLAYETARLMAETGLHDYGQAKRKAARRLGVTDEALLPRNEDIHSALREYQRLFQGHSQPQALRQRRDAALEAMAFLRAFSPRLTGPVLDGSADAHSPVILHLHTEDADDIARFLADAQIPVSAHTASIRLDRQRSVEVPEWQFIADDLAFILKALPLAALHQAPLSALDDKAAPRATAAQLRALLEMDKSHLC